jgi:hypothetical protein
MCSFEDEILFNSVHKLNISFVNLLIIILNNITMTALRDKYIIVIVLFIHQTVLLHSPT